MPQGQTSASVTPQEWGERLRLEVVRDATMLFIAGVVLPCFLLDPLLGEKQFFSVFVLLAILIRCCSGWNVDAVTLAYGLDGVRIRFGSPCYSLWVGDLHQRGGALPAHGEVGVALYPTGR